MTIQEIEEKANKIRTYRWLEKIKQDYLDMIARIEREGEYFIVRGIVFSARGDTEKFDINPHRSINSRFISEGLMGAVRKLDEEISQLKEDIEK